MPADHCVAAHLVEDLSPEDFRHVLGLLHAEIRRLTENLEAAAKAGDETAFHRVAHGIAGSASTAGTTELEQAARLAMSRQADSPSMAAMAADVRRLTDAVLIQIAGVLARGSGHD